MDFTYPPEAEAFREEFRAWLEANLDPELAGRPYGLLDGGDEAVAGLRVWNRKLAGARYAAIAWPEEYGGRGASVMEQATGAVQK